MTETWRKTNARTQSTQSPCPTWLRVTLVNCLQSFCALFCCWSRTGTVIWGVWICRLPTVRISRNLTKKSHELKTLLQSLPWQAGKLPRYAQSDVHFTATSEVERVQCHLRRRFADTLRSQQTNALTRLAQRVLVAQFHQRVKSKNTRWRLSVVILEGNPTLGPVSKKSFPDCGMMKQFVLFTHKKLHLGLPMYYSKF